MPTELNLVSQMQQNNETNYIYSIFEKIFIKFKMYLESLKYTYTKKRYMKTPCDHIFHSQCLEKWIEHKNECAYCRRNIPPLE